MSKKLTKAELADKICELEGFIEFLENKKNSFTKERDQQDLIDAKEQLTLLRIKMFA